MACLNMDLMLDAQMNKVFTNIHSAIVDLNLLMKKLVDIESDICIIPPNSFALARTVEYFKIPRNV